MQLPWGLGGGWGGMKDRVKGDEWVEEIETWELSEGAARGRGGFIHEEVRGGWRMPILQRPDGSN